MAMPKPTITLRDGSIITCGQGMTGNVVKVVQMGRRRVYQKNNRGEWYRWRGKRGWLLVRRAKRIEKLEAVTG